MIILKDKFTPNQSQWLQDIITSIMMLCQAKERGFQNGTVKARLAVHLKVIRANTITETKEPDT